MTNIYGEKYCQSCIIKIPTLMILWLWHYDDLTMGQWWPARWCSDDLSSCQTRWWTHGDTHSAGQSGGDTGILTLTICPLGSDHSIFQSFPQIPILDGDDAGVPPLIRSIKPIIQQPLPPHQSHWEGIKFTGDACYQRNLVETFYSRELWLVFKPYAFSYKGDRTISVDTVGW